MQEILEKRTITSKSYWLDQSANRIAATFGIAPIHYPTQERVLSGASLADIDLTLQPDTGTFSHKINKARYNLNFDKSKGYRWYPDRFKPDYLDFNFPVKLPEPSNIRRTPKGVTLVNYQLSTGISLQIQFFPDMIKKLITVNKATNLTKLPALDFPISGLTCKKVGDFFELGNKLAVIAKPYLWDSSPMPQYREIGINFVDGKLKLTLPDLTGLVYPIFIDPTPTYSVAASEDDTTIVYFPGSGYGNYYTGGDVTFGRESPADNIKRGFARWSVDIPDGSTINSANLKLVCCYNDGSGDTFNADVNLIDSDSCGNFSGDGETIFNLATAGTVAWSVGNWSVGTEYTSSDIKTLVQSFIDRAGYTSENYLGLSISQGDAPLGQLRYGTQYDHGGYAGPKLYVDYTEGGVAPTPQLMVMGLGQ